jgi:acyl-CoA thioester hydrolase
MSRPQKGARADYRWFHAMTTRWMDNDIYGHVNNVNYFSYFDTAVSLFEVEHGLIDMRESPVICVVAETLCRYHTSIAFPDRLAVGIRCARIGTSSARYEIGVFRNDDDGAAAEGYFVHVFVERATMRPVPIPDHVRNALRTIAVEH